MTITGKPGCCAFTNCKSSSPDSPGIRISETRTWGVEVFKASGRATLYSYVINVRPRPDMGTEPYAIAVVQLEEGPRMMTNIVNCPQTPEALQLDMPLQVTFEKISDTIALPLFEPAKG